MQKNVLGYARKIYNLPVVEAIRLQGMLEKVPDCLDAEDLDMTRIWEEYSGDPQKLEDRIDEIIFKYGINVKDYPALFV